MKFWQDAQTRGMVSIVIAMSLFSVQDVSIKWLSGDYPLHEVIAVRASIAACVLAVLVVIEAGWKGFRSSYPGIHATRGMLVMIANSAYFLALAVMPLAEVLAIFYVAPLLITALSAIFLKDEVGIRRWSAVCIGMVGVLIMVRPGSEQFTVVALLPLVGAVAYASLQVMTRKVGATDVASAMAFYIQLAFLVTCSTMFAVAGDGSYATSSDASLQFLLRAWVWPTVGDAALMGTVGILNAFGAYFLSQAYRSANAASIAPLEYVAMPLAIIWGFVLFADTPDGIAVAGILLIVGSGLYTFLREAFVRRQRARSTRVAAAEIKRVA